MSDNKHHGFLETLKSTFTDEVPDEHPAAHASAQAAPATPSAPFNFFTSPAATGVAPALSPTPAATSLPSLSSLVASAPIAGGPEADNFYQMLAEKTNFDKTDVALTIQRSAAPLVSIIKDPATLFRAAVASANVTPDTVLNTFDTLKATLARQQDSFNSHATEYEAKEITARNDRLAEIQKQLTQLQAEQAQVTSELAEAQAKAQRTHAGFNFAMQRRSAEIDQQKADYATMLK